MFAGEDIASQITADPSIDTKLHHYPEFVRKVVSWLPVLAKHTSRERRSQDREAEMVNYAGGERRCESRHSKRSRCWGSKGWGKETI